MMNDSLTNIRADLVKTQPNHHSVARFVAIDPIVPADTPRELESLLHRFHSVFAWTIYSDGEVTVEFDRTRISDSIIEEALARLGFAVTHIFYKQDVTEAEIRRALNWSGIQSHVPVPVRDGTIRI